jgi:hypothetical protein
MNSQRGDRRRWARWVLLMLGGLALTACVSGGGDDGTGDRPQVTAVDPVAGNTGAVVTTVVPAQFDRDMDPGTINDVTFTLTGQGGDIPAAVAYEAATRTAVLDPTADLPIGTFTATLGSNITDTGGTSLGTDVTWMFATPRMFLASSKLDGTGGDAASRSPGTDSAGRYVVFESAATDLVLDDTNGVTDVFVKDTQTGEVILASVDTFGVQGDLPSTNPVISADGRFVAFESASINFGAGGGVETQILRKDLISGALDLVSSTNAGVRGDAASSNAVIGADGVFVAFQSTANDLVVPNTAVGLSHIYRKEVGALGTGPVLLVSASMLGVEGDADSTSPSINGDGSFVAFQSKATNLVTLATPGTPPTQIYRKQPGPLGAGPIVLVSVDALGAESNTDATNPSINSDGRFVTFQSAATTFGAGGDPETQIFRKDLNAPGTLELVSADAAGNRGDAASANPSINADGDVVAFQSQASNLPITLATGLSQMYRKQVGLAGTGIVTLVSAIGPGLGGNGNSLNASISGDGLYVTFDSQATDLSSADANGAANDVFRGYKDSF